MKFCFTQKDASFMALTLDFGIAKNLQNIVMCGWLGLLGVFRQVYFVIGSPNYELDLLGVGVLEVGV